MKATIRDVARLAGYSINTVSRALNGKPDVNPTTRQRIEAIAAELHYTPSTLALSLLTRQTNTVGMIIPDVTNLSYGYQWRAMQRVLREHGYVLLAIDAPGLGEAVVPALETLRARHVDGVLLLSTNVPPDVFLRFEEEGAPVVQVNRYLPDMPFDYIVADNRSGAYQVTRHLIEHGHRHIGLFTTDQPISSALDRRAGYQEAINETHGAVRGDVLPANRTMEGGCAAAESLLQRHPRPTAALTYNDLHAVGFIRTIEAHGLRVPDDLALASYDDGYFGAFLTPPLTSVVSPLIAIAERAAAVLLERLAGESVPGSHQETLPVEFVTRRSCGCVPSEGASDGNDHIHASSSGR